MSYLHADTTMNISPTHVYFDALITNRNTTNTEPIDLAYYQQRTTAFLSCPEDYFFSIIRFSLDTPSLPIFIPSIDLTNTGNFNITPTVKQPTIYTITLTYTDATTKVKYTSNQCAVNWIPEMQNYNFLPNNTAQSQDTKTNYYFCYSFQWWILLCNNAFKDAFNSLKAVVAIDNIILPVSNPPFFVWNISEGLAVLNADVGISGTTDAPGGGFLTIATDYGNYSLTADPNDPTPDNYSQISIFFNSAMYQLFNSFPSIINGYGPIVSVNNFDIPGGNVQIPCFTYGGITVQTLPINPLDLSTTSNFAQISQEYTTVPMLNPIESIVFTSTTIPISPEQSGSPLIYDETQNISSSKNNMIISSITDFQSTNAQYRSYISYQASIYRFIDLFGNKALSAVDLTCYYRLKSGQLMPFKLVSGASCSLKYLFRKRNYYLN